jgi:hypothetical protein
MDTIEPASLVDWRQRILQLLWRGAAVILWLAFLDRLFPSVMRLGLGRLAHPFPAFVFFSVWLAAYLVLKKEKAQGCAAGLAFPIYVVLLPIWVPLLSVSEIWRATRPAGPNVHGFGRSFIPYLTTVFVTLLVIYYPSAPTGWIVVLGVSINVYFVFLSLATWLFRPLHWPSGALARYYGWQAKRGTKVDLVNIVEQTREGRINSAAVAGKLETLRSIHDQLQIIPDFEDRTLDFFLTVGFGRKFLVSLLHIAFLLGLLHYVIARLLSGAGAYQGLPVDSFALSWFQYFYFAAMTLVTGNTVVSPLSFSAEIVTLGNALCGVGFIVLLVTMFSMVTRDRAREELRKLLRIGEAARYNIEVLIADAVFAANSRALLSTAAVKHLRELKPFTPILADRAHALQQLVLIHNAVEQHESNTRLQEAAAMRLAAADMSEVDLLNLWKSRQPKAENVDAISHPDPS